MNLINQAVAAVHIELGTKPARVPTTLAEVAALVEAYGAKMDDVAGDGDNARPPEGDDYNWVVELIRAAVKAPVPVANRSQWVEDKACMDCRDYRAPVGSQPCDTCMRDPVNLPSFVPLTLDSQPGY